MYDLPAKFNLALLRDAFNTVAILPHSTKLHGMLSMALSEFLLHGLLVSNSSDHHLASHPADVQTPACNYYGCAYACKAVLRPVRPCMHLSVHGSVSARASILGCMCGMVAGYDVLPAGLRPTLIRANTT